MIWVAGLVISGGEIEFEDGDNGSNWRGLHGHGRAREYITFGRRLGGMYVCRWDHRYNMRLSWTRVPLSGVKSPILDRSSHSLAVVGNKAYLFGGENVPRTPVDDELYIIDLNGTLACIGRNRR
jgi:hypothetical protein